MFEVRMRALLLLLESSRVVSDPEYTMWSHCSSRVRVPNFEIRAP